MEDHSTALPVPVEAHQAPRRCGASGTACTSARGGKEGRSMNAAPPVRRSTRAKCVISSRVACRCATCRRPTETTHINAETLKLTCGECCPLCR